MCENLYDGQQSKCIEYLDWKLLESARFYYLVILIHTKLIIILFAITLKLQVAVKIAKGLL